MGIRHRLFDEGGGLKGPPPHWQQYIICVVLHLLLPLLPLLIEWWITGRVQMASLTLGASMYVIAIGLSSRNLVILILGLVWGIVLAVISGVASEASLHASTVLGQGEHLNSATNGNSFWWVSVVGMSSMFLFHLCERYNRHVAERAPFLEIGHKK